MANIRLGASKTRANPVARRSTPGIGGLPVTRIIATLASLWLLSASAALAAQPPGGDFERVSPGKLPAGWSGAATVVATDAGQCALVPGGSDNVLRTPPVPIDPRERCLLEFDLRIDHKSMNFWVQFQTFGADGKPQSPEWHNPAIARHSTPIPKFVRQIHAFDPGSKHPAAAAVSIVFKWGRDSAGTAWVDNVRIAPVSRTRPIVSARPVDLSRWVTGREAEHDLLRSLARLAPEFRMARKLPFSISRGAATDRLGVIVSPDRPGVEIPLPAKSGLALLFYTALSDDAEAVAELGSGSAKQTVVLKAGGDALLAALLRSGDGKGHRTCWIEEVVKPDGRPATLRLQARRGQVALLALTTARGGPAKFELQLTGRVRYMPADASWFPATMPLPQAAGGGLDVSFVLDPPAGKRGFVASRDGQFRFADGTRARFFGTTVGYGAAYPDHETAEALADHLARNGFNMVRIHPDSNLFDRSTGGTREFDEAQRDKLEYLMAQLKQRGIYVYFYSPMSREFTLKDGVKVAGRHHITGMWNPRRIELMKEWWTNLLTHTNPYTGLRLVDDPMLAMIVLMNENEILSHYRKAPKPYKDELQALWNAWLRQGWPTPDALAKRWGEDLREREDPAADNVELGGKGLRAYDFGLFCDEKQRAFTADMGGHLRGLGLRVPIAVTNHPYSALGLRTLAETAGFVGYHWYWGPGSMLEGADPSAGMRHLATIGNLARVRGKPTIVGEWNASWPQPQRHEILLQMPAYACLQDWDMLTHFLEAAFTPLNRPDRRATGHVLDSIFDPARQRLLPIATLMFHRMDVQPARRVVEIVAPWDEVDKRAREGGWPRFLVPPALNVPPFISRTRVTFGDPDPAADAHLTLGPIPGLPRALDWSAYYGAAKRSAQMATEFGNVFTAACERWGWREFTSSDMAARRFPSDTGELVNDFGRGVFTIDTPRCQAVVGFPDRTGRIELRDVAFDLHKPCTAVVISLSGEPIRQATRLLVATVGNSVNSSLDLSVPMGEAQLLLSGDANLASHAECDRNGHAPALIEPISGQITLKRRSGRAFVLDSNGRQIDEARAKATRRGLVLTLDGQAYLIEVRSE